ncbi:MULTISPECIES: PDR/VanB family oxidoreductase [Pseudomonas]|uniref:PDR/VanB family oxidoreductase n=1 Tax=Pseudomonas TaxID=286 RepID=UPI000CD56027|nr:MULTISPECIES: PDR/VanB family oxidoreductase [Pseudomonas]RBH55824.1 oxidoreductase [Pseudomonas sp. MWU13-2860]
MMSRLLEVRIARRKEEAEGIISLELVDPAGNGLPAFEAGAHIEVQVAPGLSRHYSLCGSPEDRQVYRLGVLREPVSRGGSARIHEQFHEGLLIAISPPSNQFRLQEGAGHSLLVGGGIGITPILAMAWRLHEIGASFEVHYCVRNRGRAAFLELLTQAPFADKVRLHIDDDGQRLDIPGLLRGPETQRHVYVCGPAGFMDAVIGTAHRQGWPAANVHCEYFAAEVDVAGEGFTLHAERSGLTLQVPEGRSIAQVLLEAGVQVPLSCEQGVCGTCLTRVLEGIPDHRDLFLTEEEKASNNQILLCCSRASSAFLRLDI